MGEPPAIGRRIHVMGNSSAGKSTLAARLAQLLDVPFVELDALNWQPGWVGLNATNPGRLVELIRDATSGDGWVVAGSYTGLSETAFWPRLETVIWLDLPASRLLARMLVRSWRRWRNRELLWGTNYERFWPQLCVWRQEDSLAWWIVTQYTRKRRDMLSRMTNPRFAHIRFVRLVCTQDADAFLADMARTVAHAPGAGG